MVTARGDVRTTCGVSEVFWSVPYGMRLELPGCGAVRHQRGAYNRQAGAGIAVSRRFITVTRRLFSPLVQHPGTGSALGPALFLFRTRRNSSGGDLEHDDRGVVVRGEARTMRL